VWLTYTVGGVALALALVAALAFLSSNERQEGFIALAVAGWGLLAVLTGSLLLATLIALAVLLVGGGVFVALSGGLRLRSRIQT
jgi:hypothetical protein